MGMWDNARRSLIKGYKICRNIDRWTTKLSFFKIRIFCGDDYIENEPKIKEETRHIDYWDLFIQRCIQESKNIQRKNWISSDDVLSVSSTATIAIPGVTITAILEDTVRRENIKELIYWNEENICKHSNRDPTDNIAQVFLPQLMRVKESMMSLKKEVDLDANITWIKASLCDGEDEKTQELAQALDDVNASKNENVRGKCLKIRASIENIVHALLRVRNMSSRLPEIFSAGIDDEENETEIVTNQNTINGSGTGLAQGIDPNEDPELALALQMSLEDERIRQEVENARNRLETEVAIEVPTSTDDHTSDIDDVSTIVVDVESELAIEMQPLSPPPGTQV